jgi:hypothetical protein
LEYTPKFTQSGIFGLKKYHLATLSRYIDKKAQAFGNTVRIAIFLDILVL